MNEPFGPRFYEWWAELPRLLRYAIALGLLLGGAVLAFWEATGSWFLWGPLALVGGLLLLLSREIDND